MPFNPIIDLRIPDEELKVGELSDLHERYSVALSMSDHKPLISQNSNEKKVVKPVPEEVKGGMMS